MLTPRRGPFSIRRRRRPGRRLRTGALLLALVAAGCASAPATPPVLDLRPLRTATLEEVLAAYDGYTRSLTTISGSGDLEVRDLRKGKARRLGMRLVAARGGRLYVKASVAVVTALEVVSDGSRFWFQVPSKKTVWTGDALADPRAEADEAPYYALRPRDVTAALLPEPLLAREGEALLLEAERPAFVLTLARVAEGRGRVRRRIWLERETLAPARLRDYDEGGELTSEVELSDWREGLPRRVEVRRPAEGYEALLTFDRLQRNVDVPARAFAPRLPEGYSVIEVGG